MPASKIVTWLCICGFYISMLSTSEGNQQPKVQNEMARLRAVQTPDGPQLEIKVGDLVCTTSQITVSRKQQKPWTLKPVNGKVEMRRGRSFATAEVVEVALRN